nr:IclR family transcriptional regulator C-terminal domain-containing protein [Haladaptatus pallidirubidus]
MNPTVIYLILRRAQHYVCHYQSTVVRTARRTRQRVLEIVDATGLPALTDETITSRERLLESLEAVRERGTRSMTRSTKRSFVPSLRS